jgi:hypothetical protein
MIRRSHRITFRMSDREYERFRQLIGQRTYCFSPTDAVLKALDVYHRQVFPEQHGVLEDLGSFNRYLPVPEEKVAPQFLSDNSGAGGLSDSRSAVGQNAGKTPGDSTDAKKKGNRPAKTNSHGLEPQGPGGVRRRGRSANAPGGGPGGRKPRAAAGAGGTKKKAK